MIPHPKASVWKITKLVMSSLTTGLLGKSESLPASATLSFKRTLKQTLNSQKCYEKYQCLSHSNMLPSLRTTGIQCIIYSSKTQWGHYYYTHFFRWTKVRGERFAQGHVNLVACENWEPVFLLQDLSSGWSVLFFRTILRNPVLEVT